MNLNYFKYYTIIIIVLIGFSVSGQSNPFEVYHTKKYLPKDSLLSTPEKKIVIKNDTKGINTTPNSATQESIASITEIQANVTDQKINNAIQQQIKEGDNPFVVRHDLNNQNKSKEQPQKTTSKDQLNIKKQTNDQITNNIFINNSLVDTSGLTNPFAVSKGANISSKVNQVDNNTLSHQSPSTNRSVKNTNINKTQEHQNNSKKGTDFIFWILMFTIFLFAILINYKRSFVLKSYRGILNENYLKLIKREENNGFSLFFLSLFIVFCLSLSSFIYLAIRNYHNSYIGLSEYFMIFGGVIIIYLFRFVFMKTLGYIFGLEKISEKYFFIILYYNILLGICLLIINVLFAFGAETLVDYSYYLGLIIIVSLLFIRNIRGLLLSIQHGFIVKIQFIFYLCAVEITPVLISMKILSEFGQ